MLSGRLAQLVFMENPCREERGARTKTKTKELKGKRPMNTVMNQMPVFDTLSRPVPIKVEVVFED